MHYRKAHGKHFVCLEQMADISPAVALAHGAITLGIYRLLIAHILFVFYVYNSVPGKQMPMPAVSRRHNTVKKVNAARNAFDYIARSSYTHEISGLVLRHIFLNGLDSIVHFLMSLADGQTSDRITRKVKLGDFLHVLYTNIREGGALVYSEQHLSGIYWHPRGCYIPRARLCI